MKLLLSIIFSAILAAIPPIYGDHYIRPKYKIINIESAIKLESMTYPVKIINVSINKPATEVYRFAANPENFPKWVQFVKSIKKQGEWWIGDTDLGTIKIKFEPKNDLGVIDHQVTLANGQTVFNPMRAIANNKGCEFIFTLFRMPGRSDKEFNDDAEAVTNDLHKLKEIMEGK